MKVLAGGVACALCLAVTPATAQANVKVFACTPEWAALAGAIGGERLEITLATSALDDPEKAAPTSEMISALEGADLIVCTGGELDKGWLPAAIERSRNQKIAAGEPGHFLAIDSVEVQEDAAEIAAHAEGGHAAHGATHVDGNPHIHGDPRNIQRVAAQLVRRLVAIDSEGRDIYAEGINAFVAELRAKIAELEAKAAPLRGARVAVPHEGSLYLLNWLGIETVITIEGPEGVAAGPARMTNIIRSLPSKQISFVIHAAYEDPAQAAEIAEKAGVPLVKLPYTIGGTEEATDFFTFYEDTVARLLDGLNGRERP